jgi:hypothetical protein
VGRNLRAGSDVPRFEEELLMSGPSGSKATVAGVLSIVSGVSAGIGAMVLGGIGVIAAGVLASTAENAPHRVAAIPLVVFLPLALLLLAMGVTAAVGGIAAINRRSWMLAVLGAAAAVFCFFPVGVASLVFLLLGEDEFEGRRRPPVPGGS